MNNGILGGLNRPGLSRFLSLIALFAFSVGASAQTYQINSLGDQPLGTAGSISCVSTVGTCTLRAAIQANNNRTTTSATVNFANIPISPDEDGLSSVIRPGSALPAITNRITIAGETHPNFDASNGYPRVRLNGEDLTTNNSGLFISGSGASGTIIRSLAVYDFRNYGIAVNNADEAQILGNRLGTYILQFGTTALEIPNFGNDNFGLSLAGSSASQVLNNRVASNGSGGIRLATGTANTLVAGNGIGFGQATGSPFRVPNVGPGIFIASSAGPGNEIGRCMIISGISNFCSGNTIVANASHGIQVAAPDQRIVFNAMGVHPDAPTNVGFGNDGDGIRIQASLVFVGNGIAPGDSFTGNVIGHNGGDGVRVISGSDAQISRNRIGGNPAGDEFGNSGAGVRILAGGDHAVANNFIRRNDDGIVSSAGPTLISGNDLIGNTDIGIEVTDWRHTIENNFIGSHQLFGLILDYPNSQVEFATVYGNWIGTASDGTWLGNSNGILVARGRALIGNDQGRGNVIAGNNNEGIILLDASEVWVRSNFIGELPDGTPRGNGGTGILLQQGPGAQGTNLSLIGYSQTNTIPPAHVQTAAGGNGRGNIIAHNALGVQIMSGSGDLTRNRFRGNRIHGNQNGGIQIFSQIGGINEGAGEGPNRLLNHPQLDDNATFFDSGSGTIEYRVLVPTLASQADYPLRLDFYITNPGESQGRFFLGTVSYPAASANNWLSGSLTPVGGYDLNDAMIVAMATDAQGNSSEFSANPADLSIGSPSPFDNIIISSFGDAPNADLSSTSCDTGNPFIAPGVPNCTLRAAIQAANNHSDPVTITFWEGLPAPGGVSTFAPGTQLPAIGGEVTLAGETHASFNAANGPSVRISGAQQSTGHGLIVSGNNSVIRHVAITGFPQDGLRIQSSGSVLVHDSLIGLAPGSGAFVADGNGRHGVVLTGASGNELRDNWISANTQRGVQIDSGSAGNALVGNRIGAGRDGSGNLVPAGNGNVGVITMGTAGFNNQIGRCEVNLPDPNPVCSGNLIVANGSAGISITGGSQVLASNWVGVNPIAPQDESFGNGGAAGIVLASNGNELQGGLQIGLGSNVIGHSAADGILITADGNQLANVLVGVTPAGDDVGNASQGIRVESGRDNQISSSRIANNVNGVVLMDGPNTVSNNRILDNQNNGVMVIDGGQWIDDNRIGGHGLTGIFFGHSVDASADGLLRITANRIGVDTDGESMPNQVGIWGLMAGRANIGEVDGLGNVIASNQNAGVVLDTTSNARIVNNHIGVLPDGTAAGNGGAGVSITTSSGGGISLQNVVGYPATLSLPAEPVGGGPDARGNVIANHLVGVIINSNETDPVLLRNSLRGNRFLNNNIGVQLGESAGGTDPGGGQQGPNRLQNPPEFDAMATFFDENSGQVEFSFRVDTLASNASFPIRVDFYLAAGSQGDVYLHTETYGSGDATQFVSGSFTPPAGLDLVGASMVGMATDDGGNSSEFSAPVSLGELTDELFSDRFEQE